MLRAERKDENATCHLPERRMDRASSGIGCLRVAPGAALGADERAILNLNTAQVVANWLIGREIVEEQQHGAKQLFTQCVNNLQPLYPPSLQCQCHTSLKLRAQQSGNRRSFTPPTIRTGWNEAMRRLATPLRA